MARETFIAAFDFLPAQPISRIGKVLQAKDRGFDNIVTDHRVIVAQRGKGSGSGVLCVAKDLADASGLNQAKGWRPEPLAHKDAGEGESFYTFLTIILQKFDAFLCYILYIDTVPDEVRTKRITGEGRILTETTVKSQLDVPAHIDSAISSDMQNMCC